MKDLFSKRHRGTRGKIVCNCTVSSILSIDWLKIEYQQERLLVIDVKYLCPSKCLELILHLKTHYAEKKSLCMDLLMITVHRNGGIIAEVIENSPTINSISTQKLVR